MASALPTVKCVSVGNSGVGKTCALISYTTDAFPGEYVPVIFDNYSANIMYNGKPICIQLWDTAARGGGDYDRLRPLSYPNTDIFLVCFSVVSQDSLNAVSEQWLPEIHHHCPGVPWLLVGNKKDLRDDPGYTEVSAKDAAELAESLGASGYCENSALTQEGLKDVFDLAVKFGSQERRVGKKARCVLL